LRPSRSVPTPALLLSIELAPLNIDTVLSNGHTQVLHGENGAVLASALPATAVPGPLNANRPVTWILVTGLVALLPRDREARRGAEVAHRIVRILVAAGTDAAVLVGIGGYVGDELLRGEREEASEAGIGLGGRRQTCFGHVVVGHGIRNLHKTSGSANGDLDSKEVRPEGLCIR